MVGLTEKGAKSYILPRRYLARTSLACGSRDIRNIVSACTVWFTLDIPHPYTPCGRGLYRQGLTRLSWGLPLRFCLASLIYILIISQGWRFVKRFSQKIPDFFDYLRYSSPQSTCSCPGVTRRTYSSFASALAVGLDLTLRVCFQLVSVLSPQPGSPLDTLIVSQLGRFVKGFFTFFFERPRRELTPGATSPSTENLSLSP